MVRLAAIAALLMLASNAVSAAGITTCADVSASGLKLDACKAQWGCLTEVTNETLVRTIVGGQHLWQPWVTVPPSGVVRACGADVVAGKEWTSRALSGVKTITSVPTSTFKKDVVLTWKAAVDNTDGTLITKPIDTFTIYKGSGPSSMNLLVKTKELRYVDLQVSVGTYFYSVTQTVDSVESARSNPLQYDVTEPPPAVAPTVSLTCTPKNGVEAVTAQCSWTSANTDKCVASGGWTGDKALTGNETLPITQVDVSYTLECSGAGGSATATETIVVTKKPKSPTLAIE